MSEAMPPTADLRSDLAGKGPGEEKRFRLRAVRGCRLPRGVVHRAGSVFEASSVEAGRLVRAGKAVVVDSSTELVEAPNRTPEERWHAHRAQVAAKTHRTPSPAQEATSRSRKG